MAGARAAAAVWILLLASAGAEGSPGDVPFFEGLGSHSRRVTTGSPQAQRYFDQGLAFLYAFNHDEAIRAFHSGNSGLGF